MRRHTRLRHTLAVIAAIVLVIAFVNLLSGGRNFVIAGVAAAIVILLILFEVRQYRPAVDRTTGTWTRTGESFVDPHSGERTDVYYNADTGQRDYRRS
jgi:hypothetical protein